MKIPMNLRNFLFLIDLNFRIEIIIIDEAIQFVILRDRKFLRDFIYDFCEFIHLLNKKAQLEPILWSFIMLDEVEVKSWTIFRDLNVKHDKILKSMRCLIADITVDGFRVKADEFLRNYRFIMTRVMIDWGVSDFLHAFSSYWLSRKLNIGFLIHVIMYAVE